MYILRINLVSIKKINKLKKEKWNLFKKIQIKGIFKIKQRKKIFTVLKSPHVNKKSREHFIYKKFFQKIEIKCCDNNIFQILNLIILIKKMLSENKNIKFKIIKI